KNLKKELETTFKSVSVNISEENRMIINVKKEQALTVLRFLKDKEYDYLTLISCVDWIEGKEFELIYILSAYMRKENITLKTRIPREKPEFKTIIPIFKNAEPYERELHELFGIKFEGHPRLTRLFLEREYKIPPFRKDFDTREYVKEFFDKIPPIEDKK
ncbi:NADH-quinone oxidoreductase subunit C, partial [candidate division WOR-3 bacterium]|nr:NADH-quinone oxidoreductase subunit C [candidate division WOR-3 bacterium]